MNKKIVGTTVAGRLSAFVEKCTRLWRKAL
jgi:hypothetical protein